MNRLSMSQLKAGATFGQYELVELLGAGGNADVWRAISPSGVDVALKICHSVNADNERYRRFCAEIRIHRRVSGRCGLLPLLDSYLPKRPSRSDRAWLAMPIATPIRDALRANSNLEDVVRVVADVADVLADLQQEGITHRDIKPDNLYIHDGTTCVGDLGIASYPGKEALTEHGRKLGPLHFHAPEMLENADTAAPAPADVYSLAKTLWVLACGQQYPPPGEQRADTLQIGVRNAVSHPRALLIDNLIERATRLDPASRPTMDEMARELRKWIDVPDSQASPDDLTDLLQELSQLKEPENHAHEIRQKWRWHGHGLVAQLAKDHLPALASTLLGRPGTVQRDDQHATNSGSPGREVFGLSAQEAWKQYAFVGGAFVTQHAAGVLLRSIVAVSVGWKGEVALIATHRLRHANRDIEDLWRDSRTAIAGTSEELAALVELSNGLLQTARAALTSLVGYARASGSDRPGLTTG